MNGAQFDYVVVGAGAAGAIVADRLSESGRHSVCLLEAGPPDRHPYLHIPAGFIKVLFDPGLTWTYGSEPTELTAGRRVPLPQGRVLGGSTSINGLVYNRGQPQDYDAWAAIGNPGWSWDEVLPYFRRNERYGGGDERYRGREGRLPVSDLEWIHPVCERFIAGAKGLGMPRNPDYNGASQAGVGYFQRSIRGRWRMSTSVTYLRAARRRPNLTVVTGAHVVGVDFDARRAIGVRYAPGDDRGTRMTVRARREVVLCAGALNTPRLLQLSGVGPAGLLARHGIAPVHVLEGVGANLSDHYSVRFVARVRGIATINELARAPRLWGQLAAWLAGRPSLLATSPSLVHWFWQSGSGLDRPDLQGVFSPASYREGYVGMLDRYPGMTCGVWQHRPFSRGHVELKSADPFAEPLIQPNYLADERDRRVLLAGMRLARALLRTPELADFADGETLPGPEVRTDDEMLDFARRFGASSYHVNGSARMGPSSDPGAVVDARLRVHGIDGLRLADASIMPSIPSANTCAATMMIGEKAADLILEDAASAN
ncbi:MAG: GMC family oxidoreductase N-terminal domain-containing protein [Burkholderiaceae bacterium]|nr:GMC family oxidoreductase N-terminal domain-containing protein [Burkholderiaceae bacterium]